jgi:hypothetical protein
LDAEAGANGRSERHDRGSPGVDEFAGGDQVVVGVGEDYETFLNENASGFDELLGVGKQRLLVADDFELDPVGEADLAGEARGTDGFISGVAAGSIWKNEDFFRDRCNRAAILSNGQ